MDKIIDTIYNLDLSLFYIINNRMQNIIFDIIMPYITESTNWIILICGFVIVILIKDYRKAIIVLAITVIGVMLSDATIHYAIKPFIKRIRPCISLNNVHLLVGCTNSFSFPSGHASNIFTVATIISHQYRRLIYIMLAIAIAVSFSRVYVGVHYPFDTLFGALLGVVCGLSIIMIKDIFFNNKVKGEDRSRR